MKKVYQITEHVEEIRHRDMKRSERVAIRLTPSLKEAVTELASNENRSLSNYIELLLSEKVDSVKK